MTGDEFEYVGTELDLFSEAANWRAYWALLVAPFVGQNVLEVGAGIGTVTDLLRVPGQPWTALEPDPKLAARISMRDGEDSLAVVVGSIDAVVSDESYDSVLYIDVLEHIHDDRTEVNEALTKLKPGGHLIVLAPAHQWLFTEFDESIGHFRRYNREALRQIRPKNSSEVFSVYADSIGTIASAANRVFLRSSTPSHKQIRLWDRILVPASRVIDPIVGRRLGKSIIMVWRKDGNL